MRKRYTAAFLLAAAMIFAGTADLPLREVPLSVQAHAESKLAAPKNVKASVSGSTLTLTWSKTAGVKAYRVYRYENGKYKKYRDTAKTKLTVKDLPAGTYKFRVAALVQQNGKYTAQQLSKAVTAKITEADMTDRITVNTQSSIRIDAGDAVIRIDPFRITGEPHDADIILITHAHYDHFSPDDLAKVSKPGTVFAAPKSMEKELSKAGIKDAILLGVGEKTEIGGFAVETVAAYNVGKAFHPKKNGWLGYIVTVDGKRIYAAGDTDANDDVKAVRCDIALIPIGGTYTMNAKEAAAFVNEISPETVIPIHFGSIVGSKSDGEKFAKLVDKSIKVVMKI